MRLILNCQPCPKGATVPLSAKGAPCCHQLIKGEAPAGVGWELLAANGGEAIFCIASHAWLPESASMLLALQDVTPGRMELEAIKRGQSVAVLTLSDKASQGLREDTAGPLAAKLISETIKVGFCRDFIIPDDVNTLRGLMAELALTQQYDLICCCGGTGIGPRDITPQTAARLFDLELPGFATAMLMASLSKTPNAAISRMVCGAIGQCLVITLPGSAKAVAENLGAILPCLGHALAKLQGDGSDCGGHA